MEKSSFGLLMSFQMFGGFCLQTSLQSLFLGDFAEGKEAVAAGGILLPTQDAVLDGFLDHLQGATQGTRWRTLPQVEPIVHHHTGSCHE